MKNLHRDLLEEREREREEKSKSRDLSNRSVKTDRGTEIGELHRDFSKEREGKGGKEQKQRSDYRSLKTDGETESKEPT